MMIMTSRTLSTVAVTFTILLGACAFVPKANPRLEEARTAKDSALADAQVARLAPREMQQGSDTLALATHAWNTLDDVAVVDHLAYLAKQRIEIAREVAKRRLAEERLARMLAENRTGGAAPAP